MEKHKLIELFPEALARRLSVVPQESQNGLLTFLIPTGSDPGITDILELTIGASVEIQYADKDAIEKKITALYGIQSSISDFSTIRYRSYSLSDNTDLSALKRQLDTAPVVALVDEIISSGIKWGASDIHIEPYDQKVRVRYRLDSRLQDSNPIPLDKKQAFISRLKVMAELDIAERRRPQDGRIRVEGDNRIVDIRVSVIPTDFGEKVVLRILDKAQLKLDLEALGMLPEQLQLFKDKLAKPNGIILVTGPTGSGKTTTLYAALNYLKNPEINITTIEDPIEYNLDNITQSQVKPEIGYTFATALRTFLRQDPDVLMVGEIRDEETAEIAVRASLTGHLVLSTLHTNDAASAITRLTNMGIEPHLLASSLSMVIAQRLVRLLCPHCKVQYTPTESEFIRLGIEPQPHHLNYTPKGCEKCLGTGYKGRLGVFELLNIDDQIGEMILRLTQLKEYRGLVDGHSFGLMKTNAIKLFNSGKTSLGEIMTTI
jgi:type IV pilus assembly protein PilB